MNAIRVRAVAGGRYSHSFHFDILAGIDDNVEHLAI
jgi:hypothetical protein